MNTIKTVTIMATATARLVSIARAEPDLARVFGTLEWSPDVADAELVSCHPDCDCGGLKDFLAVNPEWLARTTPLEAIWKLREVINEAVRPAKPVIEVVSALDANIDDVKEWN